MLIDTVRVFSTISDIADAWRHLAATTGAAPFLWPGWCAAWCEVFGDRPPTIHTVWRGDRLVALQPSLVGESAVASPTNDQTPLFGPLAVDAGAAERLVAAVVADQPQRLELGYLDPDIAPTAQAMEALRRRGYRPLTRQTLRAPYTDTTAEWDAFSARLGKKRRSELRRSGRRLREIGDLQVEVCDGRSGDLDAVLADGFRVEAAGWKGEQGTAIASTAVMRGFYTAVARWAATEGMLHLVTLRLDGRAIAFEYILRHEGVLYDLKGGYDETYRRYGPGIWLMHHILQQAFSGDVHTVEWLGTDDPYKLEWSDGVHQHVTATWLAPTLRGAAEYHSRTLWRTSRERGKDVLRERLPDTVIARMKQAAQLRTRS